MRIGGAPFNQPGEAESMVRQKTAFFRNSRLEEIKKLVQIAEELAKSHDQLEVRVADLEKQLEDAGRISG
ncbi:MAG: hypothetical protein ACJ75T_07265 [Solirubrobacterales bacterium]